MARVLVIDRDQDILLTMSMALKHLGYQPFTLDSFDGALQQIVKIAPHLILMETAQVTSASRRLCKELKEEGALVHVPVVLFSTYPAHEKRLDEFNAVGFLGKPFEIDELNFLLQRCMPDRVAG